MISLKEKFHRVVKAAKSVKLFERVDMSNVIPWYCGIWYVDFSRNQCVCVLFPFNYPLSLLRWLYLIVFLAKPFRNLQAKIEFKQRELNQKYESLGRELPDGKEVKA